MQEKTLSLNTLGKSGIRVTELGIGLWAIGGNEWGPTDDAESIAAIEAALTADINFFDTADVYGDGHSEELLGQAMQGRREQFIVASKIGWQNFDHQQRTTAYTSVQKLIEGVETNLRRLKTEYIDVMQSHIGYRDPTMEVFVEGFHKLQQQGKIRAYGLSTSDFEYIKAFNADGGCSTLQIDYSILNRTPEAEIFPYCQEHNIGVIVRGPLAMGILAGKFNAGSQFPEGDFRRNWQEKPDEHEIFMNDLQKVEQLRQLFPGRNLAQLALQFTLAHAAVSTVIPGAKNPRQLEQNLQAGLLPPLTTEELEKIDQVTPPGGGRRIWPA